MGLSEFLARRASRSRRESPLPAAARVAAKPVLAKQAAAPGGSSAPRNGAATPEPQQAQATGTSRTQQNPAPPFALDRGRMFDLGMTSLVYDLCRVPMEQRDERWREAFLPAAWNASLEVPAEPYFNGPDGFPYMRLHIPSEGPFESNSISNQAVQCVLDGRGIALFASPTEHAAQYVFSAGVLDSLLRYGSWLGDPLDSIPGGAAASVSTQPTPGMRQVRTAGDHEVLLGTPSAELLPPATARALYEHLAHAWNMPEPRVQLLVDAAMTPSRSLMINRRMSDFDSAEHAAAECRELLWYLPPNRAVTLLPDGWSDENMVPLRDLAQSKP